MKSLNYPDGEGATEIRCVKGRTVRVVRKCRYRVAIGKPPSTFPESVFWGICVLGFNGWIPLMTLKPKDSIAANEFDRCFEEAAAVLGNNSE